MESNARYFWVGLFVISALITTFVVFLVIQSYGKAQKQEDYLIGFTDSVNGISIGTLVYYLGVPVGDVSDISINQDNKSQVIVTVSIDEDVPVSQNTFASLQLQGVTGLAVVELLPGPEDGRELPYQEGMIIEGQGSLVTRLSSPGSGLTDDLTESLGRVNDLLSEENMLALSDILNNGANASKRLDETLANVNLLSQRMENQTLGELEKLLTTINTAAQSVDRLVNNNEQSIQQLIQSGEQLVSNGQQLVTSGERMINGLDQQTGQTLQAVEQLADDLRRKPAALVYTQQANGVELAQ